MLASWFLLFGLITFTNSFVLSGITGSLQTASDILPSLLHPKNDSSSNEVMSSRVKSEMMNTAVTHLLTGNENHNNTNEGLDHEQLVVYTRIGDYDDISIEKPDNATDFFITNKSLNNSSGNKTQGDQESYLERSDIQKYIDVYQDVLYTFKDFARIGVVPNIKEKSSKIAEDTDSGTTYNYTYTMRIPNTKKFFQISLPHLTKTQYDEINVKVQEYFKKKSNSSSNTGRDDETINVEVENGEKRMESRALSELANMQTQRGQMINSQINNYPSDHNEAMAYLVNMFKNKTKSIDTSSYPHPSEPPLTKITVVPLLKSNGFHSEIATDYVHKQDEDNSQKVGGNEDDSLTKVMNPIHSLNNRTKLYLQTRSKRPIMNPPNTVFNRRYPNFNSGSENGQLHLTFPASLHSSKLEFGTTENRGQNTTNKTQERFDPNNTSEQDTDKTRTTKELSEIFLLLNKTTESTPVVSNFDGQTAFLLAQKPNQSLNFSFQHVVEAAKWLMDMKKKMEEEEEKKVERYKNYIKTFLKSDESPIVGKGDDTNVMKINKQEDILQGIKLQMLDYFASLNLNISEKNDSSVESILNATNVFELMEKSSQFAKQKLQTKIDAETIEPIGFIKKISVRQVEKCKRFMNTSAITNKTAEEMKLINNKRLMVVTTCINKKIQNCVFGFTAWLRKGKFYLRPHFRISRAYENYETERNLYCLRAYDPSSLGSNSHAVKVRPGTKISRKFSSKKTRLGQNRAMIRMRKTGNRQLKENPAKLPVGRRRNNKQGRVKEQPSVQRYGNKKRVPSIVRQHMESKQGKTITEGNEKQ